MFPSPESPESNFLGLIPWDTCVSSPGLFWVSSFHLLNLIQGLVSWDSEFSPPEPSGSCFFETSGSHLLRGEAMGSTAWDSGVWFPEILGSLILNVHHLISRASGFSSPKCPNFCLLSWVSYLGSPLLSLKGLISRISKFLFSKPPWSHLLSLQHWSPESPGPCFLSLWCLT